VFFVYWWMLKACAHRRRKRGVAYEWGLGLCISMTNALDEDGFWEPCEGKPKSRGHSEYGYCQAGTSAAVDPVRPYTFNCRKTVCEQFATGIVAQM